MSQLGLKTQAFLVAIKGPINVYRIKKLVDEIIEAIEMTPVFEPAIFTYSDDIGFIYNQPLYESQVSFDGWPRHKGGYLVVTSCKSFDHTKVLRTIENNNYFALQCDCVELAL